MFRAYQEMEMTWCFGSGVQKEGCYAGSVVDCLLSGMKESWKANSTCFSWLHSKENLSPPFLEVDLEAKSVLAV